VTGNETLPNNQIVELVLAALGN